MGSLLRLVYSCSDQGGQGGGQDFARSQQGQHEVSHFSHQHQHPHQQQQQQQQGSSVDKLQAESLMDPYPILEGLPLDCL